MSLSVVTIPQLARRVIVIDSPLVLLCCFKVWLLLLLLPSRPNMRCICATDVHDTPARPLTSTKRLPALSAKLSAPSFEDAQPINSLEAHAAAAH